MKRFVFAAALLIFPSPTLAASVDTSKFSVAVTSIEERTVGARVVFSLKSEADRTATVFVDCAILDQNNNPIDVSTDAVYNVRPGEMAFSKVDTVTDMTRIKSAKCRVSSTDAN